MNAKYKVNGEFVDADERTIMLDSGKYKPEDFQPVLHTLRARPDVQVDDGDRAIMIDLGKYKPEDFVSEADPIMAPLTKVSGTAPKLTAASLDPKSLDAISGAAKRVRIKESLDANEPTAARRVAQRAYSSLGGAIADIEALPLAALYKTFDKIGGGKTPYREKYREALGDLETGPLQILSDPLNFLPTGLLGQGAKVLGQAASKLGKASDVKALAAAGAGAAKATEKLADIGKIARMPSRSADAAVQRFAAGDRLRAAREAAAPILESEARRAAAAPKGPGAWPLPFLDVTPYATMKELGKLKAAEQAVADLGAAGKIAAKIPAWMHPVIKRGAAPLHGAAEGAGYGAASTYLGTDDDELAKSALIGGIGGGLLGTLGHVLRTKGIELNPALDPSVSNRNMTDASREAIRKSITDVYDEGILPLSKGSLGRKAEAELAKLSAGPYAAAASSISGTNAGVLRKLKGESAPELLPRSLVDELKSSLAQYRGQTGRKLKPGNVHNQMTSGERAHAEHILDTWVDRNLPDHPGAKKLKSELQSKLKDATGLDDMTTGDLEASIAGWLEKPSHTVSIPDVKKSIIDQLTESGLRTGGEYDTRMGDVVGSFELPPSMTGHLERKFGELTAKQTKLDMDKLIDDVLGTPGMAGSREEAAEFVKRYMQPSTEADPRLFMDFKNKAVSKLPYRDNASAKLQAEKAAVESSIRDIGNEYLERYAPFAEALGPQTRGEFAKWRAWSRLAPHPGSTGLADRIAGLASGPIFKSSAIYKGGNLLERLIPHLANIQSNTRLGTEARDREIAPVDGNFMHSLFLPEYAAPTTQTTEAVDREALDRLLSGAAKSKHKKEK